MGGTEVRAGGAFVELFTKDSKFQQGLLAASKKLKSWGAGIATVGATISAAGAAITAPILAAAHHFAEFGDTLHKMSLRTGLTAETLSQLAFATNQSGSSLKSVQIGMIGMAKFMSRVSKGSAEVQGTLAKLGLTAEDLKGKSPEQTFLALADGIARIKDPTEQAAVAMKVFGKAGNALMPMLKGGAVGIRDLMKQADDLGLTMSTEDAESAAKLTDAWGQLKLTMGAVSNQIGAAVAPKLTQQARLMALAAAKVAGWIKQNKGLVVTALSVGAAITAVGVALVFIGGVVTAAGFALGALSSILAGVGTVLGIVLSPIGLLVVAFGAATVAWAMFTQSGQAAVAGITSAARQIFQMVTTTMGGISDAVAAGDFALAGRIAMAGLKAGMLMGVAGLADAVGGEMGNFIGTLGTQIASGDFQGAWKTAVAGMGQVWFAFSNAVVQVFATAARALIDLWQKTTTKISNAILKSATEGGWGKMFLVGTGVDMQKEHERSLQMKRESLARNQTNLAREQENLKSFDEGKVLIAPDGKPRTREDIESAIANYKAFIAADGGPDTFLEDAQRGAADQLRGQADAMRGAMDALEQQAKANSEQADKDFKAATAGGGAKARGAADAAKAELDRLREDAAKAKAEKEARDKKLRDAMAGGADAAAKASSEVRGVFSGAAIRTLEGAQHDKLDRVAKAAEKNNEQNEEIIERLEDVEEDALAFG